MKNVIKNILLLVAVFIISHYTASYFGLIYNYFSPQHGSAFWGPDKFGAITFVGSFLAYVFLVPFIFEIFGAGKKRIWMLCLLLPLALFWISADRYYIYVPIVLGIIAFAFAKLINFIISKFKHPNPPMVVK
jgi:hypothetical protein